MSDNHHDRNICGYAQFQKESSNLWPQRHWPERALTDPDVASKTYRPPAQFNETLHGLYRRQLIGPAEGTLILLDTVGVTCEGLPGRSSATASCQQSSRTERKHSLVCNNGVHSRVQSGTEHEESEHEDDDVETCQEDLSGR